MCVTYLYIDLQTLEVANLVKVGSCDVEVLLCEREKRERESEYGLCVTDRKKIKVIKTAHRNRLLQEMLLYQTSLTIMFKCNNITITSV